MTKLYKIKFIKETELHKVGDLGEATKKNAEGYVGEGYAVYVEEPKKENETKESKENNKEKDCIEGLSEEGKKLILEERKKIHTHFKKKNIIDSEEKTKNDARIKYLTEINGRNPDWDEASEIVEKYILSKIKIYTTKEDLKSEVWIYQDGIYIPQGRSAIKVIMRDLLKKSYNAYIFNLVINKIEPDTFIDSNKFFVNENIDEIPVENGILNINTLELTPFTQEKIFFNKIQAKYDPCAKCEKIEKFLRDVLSKEDDIDITYELAGFGLLKEYTFEKAFMFVGNGRNGKGKTIELLKRLVGAENTCSIPLSSLKTDNFSISELFGKLFNLAGDISNTDLKETSMFKSCTGRDIIGAKRKYLREIYFTNYAKFVFACNDLPMVYDTSRGFWDRWILLDFPFTFVTQEEYDKAEDKKFLKIKDDEIINKITSPEEMSGFLNESLCALARLKKNKKFSTTLGSEEVKNNWIRRSNSFISFCYENIEDSYDQNISKKDLRKKYASYCKEHKIGSKSDVVIKRVLQELFGGSEERIKLKDLDYSEWFWTGISWKIEKEPELKKEKKKEENDEIKQEKI